MNVKDRFLTYVGFDTQSDSSSELVPSTSKQLKLAKFLADELRGLGVKDAQVDSYGCVYGHVPASAGCAKPGLALIAHMDTAMDMSGADIKPRIVADYDGTDIVLNEERGIVTKVSEYPVLEQFIGQDLIVTDGTTLLGADDKAGVAEIVTLVQFLMEHPEYPHPPVSILFTPDEEIGRGADHVDVDRLDAACGYTVDGGLLGEFSYENFNAAGAEVTVHGVTAHTGYAKGVLKNAILIAMEYQSLLPAFESPGCTQGREGFFHLDRLEGCTETARMKFLIRDHDFEKFQERQKLMREAVRYLNCKYGEGTVEIEIRESYLNMYEKIKDHKEMIDYVFLAMEKAQVTPIVDPIRGGTDGARLSYMGLPCPNLCTGGQNGHGRHEFVSVQSMEKVVEILKNLVELYA